MNAAVVGAGMAGVTVARLLQEAGIAVTLFDKSKGSGGRLASRQYHGDWIDHGAPYFGAEQPAFHRFLQQRLASSVLATWQPGIAGLVAADEQSCYVGVPRSSAITRALLAPVCFQPSTRVARLQRDGNLWQLFNDGDSLLGSWDLVLLALPAPQARPLLAALPELATQLASVEMEPCWVTVVQTTTPLPLPDVEIGAHPHLRRITHNSAKPGRSRQGIYVLQASTAWSQKHLEKPPAEIGEQMHQFWLDCRPPARDSQILFCHRWRYGFTRQALGQPCLWQAAERIGLCGDWCLGRRVEDAWLSGLNLARQVLGSPAATL